MQLQHFKEFVSKETPIALVELTKIRGSGPRETGSWMLVSEIKTINTIGGGSLEYSLIENAKKMLKCSEQNSKNFSYKLNPEADQCCGGVIECKISIPKKSDLKKLEQRIKINKSTSPNLYLFGAGHVGEALITQACHLPLKITVVDSRLEIIESIKCKFKDRTENIDFVLDVLPERVVVASKAHSAFLVMTHSHSTDFNIVEEILRRKDIAFVGMIGSKTKKLSLKKHLKAKGFDEREIKSVKCPIGRNLKMNNKKMPEVIAALAISDILESFNE